MKRSHYELKKTLPKLAVLKEMLEESPYTGQDDGGGVSD